MMNSDSKIVEFDGYFINSAINLLSIFKISGMSKIRNFTALLFFIYE